MFQDRVNSPCPICNELYIKNVNQNGLMLEIECERCGKYKISRRLLDDKPWYDVRHLVSAWIRRENKLGLTPKVGAEMQEENIDSPEWWSTRFRHMGFPTTTIEKLNKLLQVVAENIDSEYNRQFSLGLPHYTSEVAAKSGHEIDGLMQILDELELIDIKYPKVTAKGWLRIDELNKVEDTNDSAFIAMWFSESTKEYREAVIAAVEFCGYRPVIVDQEEYSGFIMDQVVTLLQQAKFVIADFTCLPEAIEDGKVKNGVRGGVYWESGMAYGLGKPLIHTCKDTAESKDRIHFDVDQYNTIYWQEDDLTKSIRPIEEANQNPNFAEKLVVRILALVGKGSYKPE